MFTLKLFVILLLALLVLGVLAFVFDSVKETELDNPNYPTRTYKIARACSFIVKFGMILTACGIIGSLVPAGLGLAMAFAIPKPTKVQPSSWFDHSHNVASTIPFGAIVPVDWRFLLPGEKVKQSISGFCRALQLKSPAMQDIDLKYATYFVPIRLLSEDYEFITSHIDTPNSVHKVLLPDAPFDIISDSSDGGSSRKFPYFMFNKTAVDSVLTAFNVFRNTSATGTPIDLEKLMHQKDDLTSAGQSARLAKSFMTGSLLDYMGFPCISASDVSSLPSSSTAQNAPYSRPINCLPFMAYQAICNHFFVPDFQRRSDSASLVDISKIGSGVQTLASIVQGKDAILQLRYTQYESDPWTCSKNGESVARLNNASQALDRISDGDIPSFNANTIRGMFALDEFARKVEYFYNDVRKQIKYMFGVVVSDRSALSPILVDAGSSPIGISEVENTSLQAVQTDSGSDVMQTRQAAGKATSVPRLGSKVFEAEEHGVFMTLVWLRPRTSYLSRLNPMFSEFLDNNSIPNPLFAQIGDVARSAFEVDFNPWKWIATGGSGCPYGAAPVFGYNTRYVEWKYTPDIFTGDFRSNLKYWHTARDFDSAVAASSAFNMINGKYTEDSQPLNRIFSVIEGVDGTRPFQLQMRFDTQLWQPYPHIDNEL